MAQARIRAGLLVDGTGGPPLKDAAVLVEGERIVAAGPNASVPCPEGCESLDYPGLTLMPGIVDSHSHLNFPGDGTLFEALSERGDDLVLLQSAANAREALESGVTTLRDNGGIRSTVFSMKRAVEQGIVPGPRMNICGRPLTMTGGHCWPMGGEVDGPDSVRKAVREQLRAGADYVKVMATGGGTPGTYPSRASLSLEELKAAVHEAHAWGRLAVAHATGNAGIKRVLDAGFDMIAHCSFYEDEGGYAYRSDLSRRIVDEGVWVNPTMHVNRCRIWNYEQVAESRRLTAEEQADLIYQGERYEQRCDYTRRLVEAGARIVSGSDSGWAYFRFGTFVHEAEALVNLGMSPAQVLVASTLDAARSMGLDREVGSIERGKLADLILVDGDPTRDIGALGRCKGVLKGGERIVWPGDLDS